MSAPARNFVKNCRLVPGRRFVTLSTLDSRTGQTRSPRSVQKFAEHEGLVNNSGNSCTGNLFPIIWSLRLRADNSKTLHARWRGQGGYALPGTRTSVQKPEENTTRTDTESASMDFGKKMPGQIEEQKSKRATFGMGCFWAGDSLFGATPGVIRTTVGYAGGAKPSPTYRSIGDHVEVVDIEYDPGMISFTQLLSLFWNNHEYGLTTKIKRQYTSLVLYHDEEQRTLAEKSKAHEQRERDELLITEIKKFEKFYPAEDYHQKYRLQGHPWLVETLNLTSGEILRTSPLASKLNGYIAGAGTIEQFERDLPSLNLNEKASQYLRKCVIENQGNGLYC